MMRRAQIEHIFRLYGTPVQVNGKMGTGFIRTLHAKTAQNPEEYWCAVRPGLGLTAGAEIVCRGRRYLAVRWERMRLGREALYDWAILHRAGGALDAEDRGDRLD